MTEGVDYAFQPPRIADIARMGYRFAARYVGPGTADKHLSLAEAQELTRNGLSIVAVAEGTAEGLLGGYNRGRDWALSGLSHAQACGMPNGRPVYLAVDFDVTMSTWPQVRAALQGACDAIGPSRVGVYGGVRAIEWAYRDKVASWFWQTYAWSAGRWAVINHVEQYRNGVLLAGGNVDLNRAKVADFGQWNPGGIPPRKEDEMRFIRTDDTSVYIEWGVDPTSGQIMLWPIHLADQWEAYKASGHTLVSVPAIDWRYYRNGEEMLDGLRAYVQPIGEGMDDAAERPLVDPVAVANAIAARPEIARTIAENVAAQLAEITGSVTLSGSLSGRIVPPQG